MRKIELRAGQVSRLLDLKLGGSELNELTNNDKTDYHCKYSLHDVRVARLKLGKTQLIRKPFVVTVHSTHTAVGKTLVIANLAASLAWMGFRVLLIDGDSCGDLGRAVLSSIENKRITHIASLMHGSVLGRAVVPIYADGMLDLVSSNCTLSDADVEMSLLGGPLVEFSNWLERESDALSYTYDVILVDTCSHPTNLTLNLLAGSDLTLGVINLCKNPISNAAAIQRERTIFMETQCIPLSPLLLVPNCMRAALPSNTNILLELSEKFAGQLSTVIIPEYTPKSHSSKSLGIITEREPNSYAAQCFFELAKYLVNKYIEPTITK